MKVKAVLVSSDKIAHNKSTGKDCAVGNLLSLDCLRDDRI
jgi:hypothetical protein